MKLNNNTVLITGGTSGIGYALGQALLQRNNQVILLGRNKAKLEQLATEGFETVVCDLTSEESIEKAVLVIQNQYSDLNLLFNNAGIQFNYDFVESIHPSERIKQELEVNFTGQVILTQLLLPILSNAPKAWIINTTSALGIFPKTNGLLYSASKSAMRNFTLGLKYTLKRTSIKVLEFIPPVTDTPMTAGRNETKMSAQDLTGRILPQLAKEKSIVTIPKIRLFSWIAFLFPALAHKILSK
ncbi:MAG TPA: oxidoreductase [Microscillaceae bacterium]|nr:oxidoreductase [Microscillaceae bacterium]